MFPCSGFSYQYMNYIVEFFLFLKCWTDWYKKQSTKRKIYACVITGQITKQDIGQFCNLVLSEANLKLDTFHSKMLDM